MRQLRQMKKVWYFVIMAAVAFILAAVALGCTKDAPKAPTPQNLTLPSNEILQWDEVEGVMEYVVRINEDYYTVTENKLDVFELTDKAGTYVISVAARASGKLQSEWSKAYGRKRFCSRGSSGKAKRQSSGSVFGARVARSRFYGERV